MTDQERAQRIAELERRLADLKTRLPAHSIPATMLMEMEGIEDELGQLRASAGRAQLHLSPS